MNYKVDISYEAKCDFDVYLDGALEFGEDTVKQLFEELEQMIFRLEENPYSGFGKLEYLPEKYKVAHIWKHYWAIYIIYEDEKCVKVDYVIDDRQDYGRFVH